MRYIVVYGIACVDGQEGKRELIFEIPSISSNEEEVKRLVELCNANEVSPSQLEEIVSDALEAV